MLAPAITNEELTKAIKETLVKTNLFSKVVDDNSANYSLEVVIFNVGELPGGFDMHVTLITNWQVIKIGVSNPFWQEIISSSYTTTVGDAINGFTRIKLALEGAARENIKKGIEKLSNLDL